MGATLGDNRVMLSGNLVAIISSGIIHFVYSMIYPQNFDFATLDDKIQLVENDLSGLGAEELDKKELSKMKAWITVRGWGLTIILAIIWPLMSVPAQVFTRDYFAFWVLVSIAWVFGAAIINTFLPLIESQEEIIKVLNGVWRIVSCKKKEEPVEEEETPIKPSRKGTMDEDDEVGESDRTPPSDEVVPDEKVDAAESVPPKDVV